MEKMLDAMNSQSMWLTQQFQIIIKAEPFE